MPVSERALWRVLVGRAAHAEKVYSATTEVGLRVVCGRSTVRRIGGGRSVQTVASIGADRGAEKKLLAQIRETVCSRLPAVGESTRCQEPSRGAAPDKGILDGALTAQSWWRW